MSFRDKLLQAARARDSWLCVGLDPDPARLPVPDVAAFNRALIEATADLVCAYKPNLAFYEALGMPGLRALEETMKAVPPDIPIIADGKRGDVGPSAGAYARALFETWGFDAATVNPYGGGDTVEPFLQYRDKGVFVWCRSSNPGAGDFQDLVLGPPGATGGQAAPAPLYRQVARQAAGWDRHGNVGLVVGATYPAQLRELRQLCPRLVFLVPGVGPQGGEVEEAAAAGSDDRGELAIISASRQIIYASSGGDFAAAARREAERLRERINAGRMRA
ncbi:MAG: orotidine-5'-phosphate decarboxylase [Chloroflexi bacterium]|nr:orotidine-5'-phosphate decarboxylase [Chloroflexota bacterium]